MSRQDRVAAAAQRYIDNNTFAGIEWLVERRGEELARGQCGYADAAAKKPIPKNALYRIYSMTKPITSVIALILIEQGKLRLFDMLPQFDKRFAQMTVLTADGQIIPAQRPITVDDLLTHRAGFTYEFIPGCHIAQYYQRAEISSDGKISLDDMMGRLSEQPIAFQPGTQWRYSVATDALAHVCEKAAGRGIDELMKEYIFDPLGMDDTAYFVPDSKRARLMAMYGITDITDLAPLKPRPQELTPADVEEMYPSNMPRTFRRGGHGLFSTLDDYTKFARMLLSGKSVDGKTIISRKMLEMMRANRIPPSQLPLNIGPQVFGGYGWGLGVRVMMDVGRANSLTGDGELGWAGAASTYFWVDPKEEMTGVIMTQYLGAMLPMNDDLRVAAYQMVE
ncbi:MAG TPA: serine hydrolase domain-containing protein [Pseudomonadales bacterium]|nr:serine hydrolase domain-containing protein [Pseudomonadales bacterium]